MSEVDWIIEATSVPGRLTRLAVVTHGLFNFQQAGRVGITPDDLHAFVADQVLEEFDEPFVYRHLAGTGPWYEDFYRDAWVSVHPAQFPDERTGQYQRPSEIVSGQWALSMQGPYPSDARGLLLFSEGPTRPYPALDIVVHPILRDDWTWIAGLPVARPATAIADMILALDDEETISGNLREALRQGDFDIRRFIDIVRSHADHNGETTSDGAALFRRLFGDGDTWISHDNVITTSTRLGDDVIVTSVHPTTDKD